MTDRVEDVVPEHTLLRDVVWPVYDLREGLFVGIVMAAMATTMGLIAGARVGVLLMAVLWWGRGLAQLKNRPSLFRTQRSNLTAINRALGSSPSLVESESNVWRSRSWSFPNPYRAAVRVKNVSDGVLVRGPRPALVGLRERTLRANG